eukprot:3350203-Rhodomonas_salina.1
MSYATHKLLQCVLLVSLTLQSRVSCQMPTATSQDATAATGATGATVATEGSVLIKDREWTRSGSWAKQMLTDPTKTGLVLTPGLHHFDFKDREGRVIPVHYYISGDFSIGVDENDPSTEADPDDEEEEQAEGSHDTGEGETDGDAPPDDEGVVDMEFEKECLEHEEQMISQVRCALCFAALCENWDTHTACGGPSLCCLCATECCATPKPTAATGSISPRGHDALRFALFPCRPTHSRGFRQTVSTTTSTCHLR